MLRQLGLVIIYTSSVITVAYLASFTLTPILVTIHLCRIREHFDGESVINAVGALVDGVRLEESEDVRSAVLMPLLDVVPTLLVTLVLISRADFFRKICIDNDVINVVKDRSQPIILISNLVNQLIYQLILLNDITVSLYASATSMTAVESRIRGHVSAEELNDASVA